MAGGKGGRAIDRSIEFEFRQCMWNQSIGRHLAPKPYASNQPGRQAGVSKCHALAFDASMMTRLRESKPRLSSVSSSFCVSGSLPVVLLLVRPPARASIDRFMDSIDPPLDDSIDRSIWLDHLIDRLIGSRPPAHAAARLGSAHAKDRYRSIATQNNNKTTGPNCLPACPDLMDPIPPTDQ